MPPNTHRRPLDRPCRHIATVLYLPYALSETQASPLPWSSLKDLRLLPEEVQDVFGSAFLDAQYVIIQTVPERSGRASRPR